MLSDSDFKELLRNFPLYRSVLSGDVQNNSNLCKQFAFAYGSGVVQQAGYEYEGAVERTDKLPMLDFIFVTDDPIQWHEENIARNRDHYSSFIDPNYLVRIVQGPNSGGVAMWFNVEVPLNISRFSGRFMKYGVISTEKLLDDLLHWKYLYVAGRLHKPVHLCLDGLTGEPHKFMKALEINRKYALRVALLTLPKTFSEVQLYAALAGISYKGDPRMLFAENPNKVMNMVLPNTLGFRSIYQPLFAEAGIVSEETRKNSFDLFQNFRDIEDEQLCMDFPKVFVNTLSAREKICIQSPSSPPVARAAAVNSALWKIVGSAATQQTLKGLLCVGPGKGMNYFLAKVLKRFKR